MKKMERIIVEGELEQQTRSEDSSVCEGIKLGCPGTRDINKLKKVCNDKCMYPLCTQGYNKINCQQEK